MYLRWQSRKRRAPAYGRKQNVHWVAVLVENVRVGGKPTQRHIAYLGSITDSAIAIVHQRCWFWESVTERLDRLGRVSSEKRKSIEAAIAKKVRRPTKAQYDRCVREWENGLK
jgi:hypothetical protein